MVYHQGVDQIVTLLMNLGFVVSDSGSLTCTGVKCLSVASQSLPSALLLLQGDG